MSDDFWSNVIQSYRMCLEHGSAKHINKIYYDESNFEVLIEDYQWREKDMPPRHTKAILFRVYEIKDSGRQEFHNVMIGLHPDTKQLHVWCGDAYIRNHYGLDEAYCIARERLFKTHGIAFCRHIAYVLYFIVGKGAAEYRFKENIERFLLNKISIQEEQSQESKVVSFAIETSQSLLLYGPTGSGKTFAVLQAVKRHNIPIFRIHISDGLEDIDLLQKLTPDPENKAWKRIDGELVKAFKKAEQDKVVILLEELTRSSKSLRNLLVKAMDEKDGMFTLHDFTSGDIYHAPAKNIIWIGTANFGSSYLDTVSIDPALLRRFSLTHFVDYDVQKEKNILVNNMNIPEEIADKMIEFAEYIRTKFKEGQLPYALDTGTLTKWAEIYLITKDIIQAAQLVFLNRIVNIDSYGYPDKAQQDALLEILELTFKDKSESNENFDDGLPF